VGGHASQRAQQQTQASPAAQAQAAEAITAPVKHGPARWLAWEADAAAALAAYAHRGPGWRGRRPQGWRYHVGRARVGADTRRTRRARRGRPAKTEPLPPESG
jgi:hypothetical protein